MGTLGHWREWEGGGRRGVEIRWDRRRNEGTRRGEREGRGELGNIGYGRGEEKREERGV